MTKEEIDKLKQADPNTLTSRERSLTNLIHPAKGEVRNPVGRIEGSKNKVNKDTKNLLALAVDRLQPAFEKALTELLASDNPIAKAKAMEVYLRFTEFARPRLAAVAVKTDGGESNKVLVIGAPPELNLAPTQPEIVPTQEIIDVEPIQDNLNSNDMVNDN